MELFFEGGSAAAGEAYPVGRAVVQRGGQFFPAPADGVDVQAGDAGDEPVPAVAELGRLDSGVPAALLLIEPTEQQVHLPVEFPVGVCLRGETLGALALMDFLLRHGLTFGNLPVETHASLPETWNLVLVGPIGSEPKTPFK